MVRSLGFAGKGSVGLSVLHSNWPSVSSKSVSRHSSKNRPKILDKLTSVLNMKPLWLLATNPRQTAIYISLHLGIRNDLDLNYEGTCIVYMPKLHNLI